LQGSWSEISTLNLVYLNLHQLQQQQLRSQEKSLKSDPEESDSSDSEGDSDHPLLAKKLRLSCKSRSATSIPDSLKTKDSDAHSSGTGPDLQFDSDFSLGFEAAEQCQLKSFFKDCVSLMGRAQEVEGIREEEYLLLKAIVLANSNTVPPIITEDRSSHQKLKSDILTSFHDCVVATRSVKKAPVVTQNLLLLLPLVRQADLSIKAFLREVHKRGNFKLNKLLVEMLEA